MPIRAVSKGLAYARGERLHIDEIIKSIGEVPVGQERHATFALSNLTNVPITIVGAKSSCGCTGIDGLPLTIPRNETGHLVVRIKAAMPSGTTEIALRLFTDDIHNPEVGIVLIAQMVPDRQAFGARRRCRRDSACSQGTFQNTARSPYTPGAGLGPSTIESGGTAERQLTWSTIFTTTALTAAAVATILCPASSSWAGPVMECGYHTVPSGPKEGQIDCFGNCSFGKSCIEVFTYEPPNPEPTGKKCVCIPDVGSD